MSSKIEEIIEDKHNPERIFPVLSKLGRIWDKNREKTLCTIYKEVTEGKELTDLEFTKALEAYIDKNGIK